MAHGLTPKQERFCVEYFRCGNSSEAYRIAYDSENMNENTIGRKAYDVLNNGKVTARLDELKNKVAQRVIATKERAAEVMSRILEGAYRNSDRIAATKQLGKMLGWEAPAQQEIHIVSPFTKYMLDKNEPADGS